MKHLHKFLSIIKSTPDIFKRENYKFILGLSSTAIADLKKYSVSNGLITSSKNGLFITDLGEKYLLKNKNSSWIDEINYKRPEVNLEYLKEEKTPIYISKAIRLLAKHYFENEEIKDNSVEDYIIQELYSNTSCKRVIDDIKKYIFSLEKVNLQNLFTKFSSAPYGLTNSLLSMFLMLIFSKNKDKLAFFYKNQFQIVLDHKLFDLMSRCPEYFEIKKTILDNPILEDISKVLLEKPSSNILEITKGLLSVINDLDRFTQETNLLSEKTLRFRNIILYARNPEQLFLKDIPQILCKKKLEECDEDFIIELEAAINELKNNYNNLLKNIKSEIFNSFNERTLKSLQRGFNILEGYLTHKNLKVMLKHVSEASDKNTDWIEKIANTIIPARVPKSWNDRDYARFKLKIRKLGYIFTTIKTTIGKGETPYSLEMLALMNKLKQLSEVERMTIIRKAVNF